MDNETQYFPRLIIPNLKIIANRWPANYPEVPINRITIYKYSPKHQRYLKGRVTVSFVIVFEIDADNWQVGLSGDELLEEHKKRCFNPSELDKFVADTEYRILGRSGYNAFMANDFVDVYKTPPNTDFRKDWVLYPKFRNDSMPGWVATDEPSIVLFKSIKAMLAEVDEEKERILAEPVSRNVTTEREVWDKHIEPIIEKHCLKTKTGDKFEYKFFDKEVLERDIDSIYRMGISFCTSLNPPWDEDQYGNVQWDFIGYIRRLRDSSPGEQFLINGKPIDLKNKFWGFLNDLFHQKTLPEFLEFLRRNTTEVTSESSCVEVDRNIPRCDICGVENQSSADFIQSLKFSFENDNELQIQVPKRKAKSYTSQSIGFRDQKTKEWKALIGLLLNSPHTFELGKSRLPGGRPNKEYGAKAKLIKSIEKKLIAFFGKEFKNKIPSNHLFILDKCEKPGTYKPVFQIKDDIEVNSYFAKQPKEKLLSTLKELVRTWKGNGDTCQSENIQEISLILLEKHNVDREEIENIVNGFRCSDSGRE